MDQQQDNRTAAAPAAVDVPAGNCCCCYCCCCCCHCCSSSHIQATAHQLGPEGQYMATGCPKTYNVASSVLFRTVLRAT